MKRSLALLLAAMLLMSLAACKINGPSKPETTTDMDNPVTTANGTTDPPPIEELPSMDAVLANWAWGVTNGTGESPATRLALTEYAFDCDFNKLTLALTPFGQAELEYKGEKKGEKGAEEEFTYFTEYAGITGPDFALKAPMTVDSCQPPAFLVDKAALGTGLLPLEHKYDYREFSCPPAAAADIAKAEAMQQGRKVMKSELLAVTPEGVRTCMFLYENRPDEALFSIMVLDGDKALAYDQDTDNIGDDGAYWRVDLEADDVGLLEPLLLCRTKDGMLLVLGWTAPEAMAQLVLREKGGALEDMELSGMYYSRWDDKYHNPEEDD